MKQSTTALILAMIATLAISHRAYAVDCTQSSDTSIASAKKLDESERTRGKHSDDSDSDDESGSKAGSGESRGHRGPPPGGGGDFSGGPGGAGGPPGGGF